MMGEPSVVAAAGFGSGLAGPAVVGGTTTGGAPALVVLVFVALVVATVLSIYLAVRLYQGYREGGGVGMLVLGVGLVFLTTVPMGLRFVLSNVPGVSTTGQELLATASQLVGLLVILGVIHGRR